MTTPTNDGPHIPGATSLEHFTRITARAETVHDVETWVRAALDHGPNGTRLLRPVDLCVELPR